MTLPTLKKIVVANDDQDLATLLDAWVRVVERYIHISEGNDNCWWYNERATLSSLAGAAWTLDGWIALEEFAAEKRAKVKLEGAESGDRRKGRCDLYIANERISYAIEAKQAWQRISSKADPLRATQRGMSDAWRDSGHLVNDYTHRFAATFVVPVIPLSGISIVEGGGELDQEAVMTALNNWLEMQSDFVRPKGKRTSYAYVFPMIGNRGFNSRNGRHYPGVVLVLEERLKAI